MPATKTATSSVWRQPPDRRRQLGGGWVARNGAAGCALTVNATELGGGRIGEAVIASRDRETIGTVWQVRRPSAPSSFCSGRVSFHRARLLPRGLPPWRKVIHPQPTPHSVDIYPLV